MRLTETSVTSWASESYRVDINSNLVSDGGTLTGSWSESNRNISGRVSGRVSGSQIRARVDGPGFLANLAISVHGGRQSVTIQSPGHAYDNRGYKISNASAYADWPRR